MTTSAPPVAGWAPWMAGPNLWRRETDEGTVVVVEVGHGLALVGVVDQHGPSEPVVYVSTRAGHVAATPAETRSAQEQRYRSGDIPNVEVYVLQRLLQDLG